MGTAPKSQIHRHSPRARSRYSRSSSGQPSSSASSPSPHARSTTRSPPCPLSPCLPAPLSHGPTRTPTPPPIAALYAGRSTSCFPSPPSSRPSADTSPSSPPRPTRHRPRHSPLQQPRPLQPLPRPPLRPHRRRHGTLPRSPHRRRAQHDRHRPHRLPPPPSQTYTFAANLTLAAGMTVTLLAAHEGLVRFNPILGSKDLAEAINQAEGNQQPATNNQQPPLTHHRRRTNLRLNPHLLHRPASPSHQRPRQRPLVRQLLARRPRRLRDRRLAPPTLVQPPPHLPLHLQPHRPPKRPSPLRPRPHPRLRRRQNHPHQPLT